MPISPILNKPLSQRTSHSLQHKCPWFLLPNLQPLYNMSCISGSLQKVSPCAPNSAGNRLCPLSKQFFQTLLQAVQE